MSLRSKAVLSSAPRLPMPVLEFAANEASSRALPPLVQAPCHPNFSQVSSNLTVPPALRMFPPNSTTFCPAFTSIHGTFAPPFNVMEAGGLQIVPPLTPAYMAMQQRSSLPLGLMTVAPVTSLPSVRTAFPPSSFVQPPPLRLHLPNAPSQSSGSVTASFQALRPVFAASNSVRPPLLRMQLQNSAQNLSALCEPSVTSLYQSVRPVTSTLNSVQRPLLRQLRLPFSAAPSNFSCFNIPSANPTLVSGASCLPQSAVSVAVITVTRTQTSTSVSCSQAPASRRARRSSSAIDLTNDVIDVDEGSPTELTDSDKRDDMAIISSTAESGPDGSGMEAVTSSSTASTDTTAHLHSARFMFPKSSNYFQLLHAGFDCLQHIFQYLNICSRLRAAQVCHCWRRVALQQHLVNSVYYCTKSGGVMWSFVLPVCYSVSGITHDCVNRRRPNIVGMGNGWPSRSDQLLVVIWSQIRILDHFFISLSIVE